MQPRFGGCAIGDHAAAFRDQIVRLHFGDRTAAFRDRTAAFGDYVAAKMLVQPASKPHYRLQHHCAIKNEV